MAVTIEPTTAKLGGDGIPVTLAHGTALRGVEAVIDKDATAALLARQLEADVLVILTDVDAVHIGWGSPDARRIPQAWPDALRPMPFPAGTIGPKVDAACRFVTATGLRAAIGRLDAVADLPAGTTGTQIFPRAVLRLDPVKERATAST